MIARITCMGYRSAHPYPHIKGCNGSSTILGYRHIPDLHAGDTVEHSDDRISVAVGGHVSSHKSPEPHSQEDWEGHVGQRRVEENHGKGDGSEKDDGMAGRGADLSGTGMGQSPFVAQHMLPRSRSANLPPLKPVTVLSQVCVGEEFEHTCTYTHTHTCTHVHTHTHTHTRMHTHTHTHANTHT